MSSSTRSIVYWYSLRPARRRAGASRAGGARGRLAAVGWLGVRRRVGEEPAQVAVVELADGRRRSARASPRSAGASVLSNGATADRPLGARSHRRRAARELAHQLVHVLELPQRRPALVALAPLRLRVEPDRERLGEILVGMALRVPGVEVDDEALAVGPRRVELGVGLARAAEELAARRRRRRPKAFSIAWPASWRRIFMHHSAVPPSTSSI